MMQKPFCLIFIFFFLVSCSSSSPSTSSNNDPANDGFAASSPRALGVLDVELSAYVIISLDPSQKHPLTLDLQTNLFKGEIMVPTGSTFDLTVIYEAQDPTSGQTIEIAHYVRKGVVAQGEVTNVHYQDEEENWETLFDLIPETPNALNLDGDEYNNFVEIGYRSDPTLAGSLPEGPRVNATHKDPLLSMDVGLPAPGADIISALSGDKEITIEAITPFDVESIQIISPEFGYEVLSTDDEVKKDKRLKIKLKTRQFVAGQLGQMVIVVRVTDSYHVVRDRQLEFAVFNEQWDEQSEGAKPKIVFNNTVITGPIPEGNNQGVQNAVTLDGSLSKGIDGGGSLEYLWSCIGSGFQFTSSQSVAQMSLPNITRSQNNLVITCTLQVNQGNEVYSSQVRLTVQFVNQSPQMIRVLGEQKEEESPNVLRPDNFSITWAATDPDGADDIAGYSLRIMRKDRNGSNLDVTSCQELTLNTLQSGDDISAWCTTPPLGYGEILNPFRLSANQDYEVIVTVIDKSGATGLGTTDMSLKDYRLTGYWRFEENLNDESGNGRHATFNGASPANMNGHLVDTGTILGKALSYDNNRNKVEVADEPGLNFASHKDFTMMAWIYSRSTGGDQKIIWKLTAESGFQIAKMPTTGKLIFMAEGCEHTISDREVTSNQWHHVVATRRDGETRLYIDGEWVGFGYCKKDLVNGQNLIIGTDAAEGDTFDGSIGEVAIYYNNALNADEIRRQCRIKDPTGIICKDMRAPLILQPAPGDVLPPTRAFLAWRGEQDPAGNLLYLGNGVGVRYDRYDDDGITNVLISNQNILQEGNVNYYVIEDLTGFPDRRFALNLQAKDRNNINIPNVISRRSFSTNSGLVAWWELDEGSGNVAEDSSGNYNGTLNGAPTLPTWVNDGLLNHSLFFDGQNNAVRINDNNALNFGSGADFTIGLWFNSEANNSSQKLIEKSIAGPTNKGFELSKTRNNTISFFDRQCTPINSSNILPTNEWHHVVATRKNNMITLYENGSPVGSMVCNNDLSNNNPMYIGSNGAGEYFDGMIDEVSIDNSALSSQAVVNDFCAVQILAFDDLPTVCGY